MAVYLYTDYPQALLDAFDDAIEDGVIVNWELDDDGDYTHASELWGKRAWFTSSVGSNHLAFYLVPDRSEAIPRATFAFYQANLIETFIAHLHRDFDNAVATAEAEGDDQGDVVDMGSLVS
jgi:hypothetical protein